MSADLVYRTPDAHLMDRDHVADLLVESLNHRDGCRRCRLYFHCAPGEALHETAIDALVAYRRRWPKGSR